MVAPKRPRSALSPPVLTEGGRRTPGSPRIPGAGQPSMGSAKSLQESEQRLLGDFAASSAQLPVASEPPARAQTQRLRLKRPVTGRPGRQSGGTCSGGCRQRREGGRGRTGHRRHDGSTAEASFPARTGAREKKNRSPSYARAGRGLSPTKGRGKSWHAFRLHPPADCSLAEEKSRETSRDDAYRGSRLNCNQGHRGRGRSRQ